MEKILVSACLLGEKKRYDGGDNYSSELEELRKHYDLVPFCPEVEGGLSIPRNPSEIRGSRVLMSDGTDVSRAFNEGAEKALKVCRFLGIVTAVLKEGSPSCGTHEIHSGYFDGKKKEGQGIAARYLSEHGVKVYSEHQIVDLLSEIERQRQEKEARIEWGRQKRAEKAEADRATAENEHPSSEEEKKPYSKPARHERTKSFGAKKTYGNKKSYSKRPSWKSVQNGESSSGTASTGDQSHRSFRKSSYNAHRPWAKKKSYAGGSSYGKKSFGTKRTDRGKSSKKGEKKGE